MNGNHLYSTYIKLSQPKMLKYNQIYINTVNSVKKDEYINTSISTRSNPKKSKLNEVLKSFLSSKIKSKSYHSSQISSNKKKQIQTLTKTKSKVPFISSYSCKNSKTYKSINYSHRKIKSSLLISKKNKNFLFLKGNYILMKPLYKLDEGIKQKISKILLKKKSYFAKKNHIDENKKEIRNIDPYSMTNRIENKSRKLFDSLIYKKENEVKNKKDSKKSLSHIKLGSEGILTDIILKNRKVINCINSRLCFPYLMNDKNIMNNIPKSRKIIAENNFL